MKDIIKKLEILEKEKIDLLKSHPNKNMVENELKKIAEFEDFRMSLLSESDRGCVLMAAAFIEDKITQLLETYMVQNKTIQKKIFYGNGALATFSSKIDIAFLLGLIPKNIYDDLGILRKLRNDFAHNAKSITFQTDYVEDRCMALQTVSKVALRNDNKAYFLRSMTTILTCINMKMDTFTQCKEETNFDVKILDDKMKEVSDILKGPFRILCQLGKIENTKGHKYENRNRCRAIC